MTRVSTRMNETPVGGGKGDRKEKEVGSKGKK